MTIKPVDEISAPKYPDKYNEEIQRVLAASKPHRWLSTPLATGMLAATIALNLSGCAGIPTATRPPGTATSELVEMTGDPAASETTAPRSKPQESKPSDTEPPETCTPDIFDYVTAGEPVPFPTYQDATLIPLFEYGEGTGSIGCLSIAAPVFLSEDEAYAIISAAFADAGMALRRSGGIMENINIPITNIYDFEEKTRSLPTIQGNMAPDGILADLNLPVIFVSTQDVESWHEDTNMVASVSNFNTKKAAQTLADNNPDLVVFYDPIAGLDYDKLMTLEKEKGESDEAYYKRCDAIREEESLSAKAESEQLLRKQAEAFIAWLEYGDEG